MRLQQRGRTILADEDGQGRWGGAVQTSARLAPRAFHQRQAETDRPADGLIADTGRAASFQIESTLRARRAESCVYGTSLEAACVGVQKKD